MGKGAFDPTPGINFGISDLFKRGNQAVKNTKSTTNKNNYGGLQSGEVKGANTSTGNQNQPKQNSGASVPTESRAVVSGGGAGGSGGGPTAADLATAAFFGDKLGQIRGMLGGIGTQRDQGITSINDDYSRNESRLNEDHSKILRDIGINRDDASQNKLKEVNKIDNNVANVADSYRRLAAMANAGNSSFAREFIPTAAGRMGSKERAEVFEKNGRDMRGLDLAEGDANDQLKRKRDDLTIAKNDRTRSFLEGISSFEQQLKDQAADAAYKEQVARGGGADAVRAAIAPFSTGADQVMNALSALFSQYRNPQLSVAPIEVDIPQLSNYTADQLVAGMQAENPETSVQDLPYVQQLKKRIEQPV